jgi:hypothetical protein
MGSEDNDGTTDDLVIRSLLALQGTISDEPADDAVTERFRAAMRRARTDPAEVVRIEALAAEFGPEEETAAHPHVERTLAGVGAPIRAFAPQMLPRAPIGSGSPPVSAPRGTVFVVGPEGGYAVPPCAYTLLFGRDREDVHVAVGVDDPTVSRRQGVITCTGLDGDWWLRNTGKLPIELPDGALLLTGHMRIIEPGYTPLLIHSPGRGSYLIEVLLVGGHDRQLPRSTTTAPEMDPETVYELSPQERLVVTALAKRYLQGEDRYPLPMTWEETARLANASPYVTRSWSGRSVAHIVENLRERLHRRGVGGLLREEFGEAVGSMINVNLIRELIRTVTLTTEDLDLLARDD